MIEMTYIFPVISAVGYQNHMVAKRCLKPPFLTTIFFSYFLMPFLSS